MDNEKRNNALSPSLRDGGPMPANYTGGDKDFAVVRTLDSHWYGRNAHYPNADSAPNLDDANYNDPINPSDDLSPFAIASSFP